MIDRWKLYDLIYDKANKLLKEYNPCNIHINTDGVPICNNIDMCSRGGEKLCCFQCHYWDNGCTVKCLGCKITLCHTPSRTFHQEFQFEGDCLKIETNKLFKAKMWKLVRITMRYELFLLHATKEELFEDFPILEENNYELSQQYSIH